MAYTLITLSDEEVRTGEISATEVADILARRIRNASAMSRDPVIAVRLRPEMEAGVELLELIERWVILCTGVKKRLVVLPVTDDQVEALAVSHPDQRIEYVASVEDLEMTCGRETVTAAPEPPAAAPRAEPPVIEVVGPRPAAASAAAPVRAPQQQQAVIEPPAAGPVITAGAMVEISGEYTCLTCLASRTWLKGDRITACDNPECLNPAAGFQLSCDLF